MSVNQLLRLFRNNNSLFPLRKKHMGANMQRRKYVRRLKRTNIYHKDFTGQPNPNSWFTPKRLKAVVAHYTKMRNSHPGTIPIPQKQREQLTKIFTQDSQYQYYQYRNQLKQHLQKQELQSNYLQQQINQIPYSLRKDINTKQIKLPQLLKLELLFQQQYNICLPEDQIWRYNLRAVLQNPIEEHLTDFDNDDEEDQM